MASDSGSSSVASTGSSTEAGPAGSSGDRNTTSTAGSGPSTSDAPDPSTTADCETACGEPPEPRCDDEALNAEETDVDCGGPDCDPCAEGGACSEPADCASGLCDAGTCAPSCDDGVRNGDEVDVDCGPGCAACEVGASCSAPEHCGTGVCAQGACQARVCSDLPADASTGIHPLYFDALSPETSSVDGFCDMETDGGGWTLVLAYQHIASENEPLVSGELPTSPSVGYSHASSEQLAEIRVGATAARFHCSSSGHDRDLHFRIDVPEVLDYLANIAGANDPVWWQAEHTALAGHTAALPATTNNAFANTAPQDRLILFPFYALGASHWAVRASGIRWECDDFAGGAQNDTLHQVWFR